MNVSKNELTALLKQTFEALGFFSGEYERAAETIVWTEMNGMGGLGALNLALPYFAQDKHQPTKLISDNPGHATLDAENGSSLSCADLAMDLAFVKASTQGFATVTVLNCHNRKLLLKSVIDCGRRDMACMAYWRNASNPIIEHVCSAGSGVIPHYRASTVPAQGNIEYAHRQSLFICCSSSVQRLDDHFHSRFRQAQEEITTAETAAMERHYRNSLSQGLDIDEQLWQRLQQLAKKVLVESSAQSRMGAGS